VWGAIETDMNQPTENPYIFYKIQILKPTKGLQQIKPKNALGWAFFKPVFLQPWLTLLLKVITDVFFGRRQLGGSAAGVNWCITSFSWWLDVSVACYL